MKKLAIVVLALIVLGLGVPTASADTIYLNYWELSLNGGLPVNPPGLPDPYALSPTIPGPVSLPTMVQHIWNPGPGSHYAGGFFDFDVIGPNNIVNNETGAAVGGAAFGQSWGIGDPLTLFTDYLAGTLSSPTGTLGPMDVSTALGWNFNLAGLEKARVTYYIATALPAQAPAFYLWQHDAGVSTPGLPATPATDLYFWSTLEVGENFDEPVIPEPGTMLLLGTGLIACTRRFRRR